jgi:SHOCT-like domain
MIDTGGPDGQATATENSLTLGAAEGDCVLRLPEGGLARIESVAGDMRVKGLFGGVDIGQIDGDFAARRCGPLTIGQIRGDAALRQVDGELFLESVEGDVALQDCGQVAHIGRVGGDCAATNVPEGLQMGQVGGSLKVRTTIAPGATFTAQAQGDIQFRFSADAGVRFNLPGDSNLHLDGALKAVAEGDRLIVMVGGGEATAELAANGTLHISLDDGYANHTRSRLDQDFDAYMMDVSTQIDTHLRGLEQHLGDLPERVRSRVERNINAALRNVESAERHARQEAQRPGPTALTADKSISGEPVSEEERLAILKMLENGKVSVEQAQKLLSALEGED